MIALKKPNWATPADEWRLIRQRNFTNVIAHPQAPGDPQMIAVEHFEELEEAINQARLMRRMVYVYERRMTDWLLAWWPEGARPPKVLDADGVAVEGFPA